MKVKIDEQGGIATIAPAGRFEFNTHREFRAAYREALAAHGVRAIHIDLKDTNYLDSAALGMLLLLSDKAKISGHTIAILNSHGEVNQILDVANFGKLFSIR